MLLNTEKNKTKGQGALSNSALDKWRYLRWRGRTDLYFLAHDILGYNETNYAFGINEAVHRPLIDHLQQFPMPSPKEGMALDLVRPAPYGCVYPYGGKPYVSRKKLEGARRRLILDFRSAFKTTINCCCHTIQWLLNYPDVAMLMVQSTTDKAEKNLLEVKSHFVYNDQFRAIYPDYCPVNAKKDWGNRTEFTLPNRQNKNRKEPSVMTASIDKRTAGLHVEVIKCSDIVEEGNTRTAGQMEQTAYAFEMFKKLLVDPDDFIDLEGTRYDFSDLSGKIIDAEMKRPSEKRQWSFYIRGVYKKDTGGKPYTFQPEELELPYLRDKDGQFVSWWPERFPVEMLEQERYALPESEEVFATQMLNNPLDATGKQVFDVKNIAWIDRDEFEKAKIAYRTVTVDTAETQNERSDFTAITIAAWDKGGRCYIEDIRNARMTQNEIIDNLFGVWVKYKPVSIKIEETGFVRGLKSSVSRMSEKLGIYPVFEWIPRDTQTGKQERIKGIQSWFNSGDLRFLSDLKCRQELTDQLGRFPKYKYDDILDTIADQFQNRDTFGRLSTRQSPEEVYKAAQRRFFLEGDDDRPKFDEVQQLTGL